VVNPGLRAVGHHEKISTDLPAEIAAGALFAPNRALTIRMARWNKSRIRGI
jgi:hypothetical protein